MSEPQSNSVNTKHRLRVEIKEISATGEFEGLLSVYNVVDQGNDVVEPGAFTKTIKERGGEVPLLWQHKTDTPIGMLSLQDGPDALRVTGKLLMELDDAKKAYLLIKSRIVRGLSIGFETIKDSIEGGVRHLKELKLFEGSIVTFPMLEAAQITSVKKNADGTEQKDFNEELTNIQLCDAGDQIMNALYLALRDLRWSMDISSEESVSASETVIEQFSQAYLAYLPAYLAMMSQMMGGMETMSRKDCEAKTLKAGRRISKITREQLTNARNLLDALLEEEAGSSTSEPEAAKSTKADEPEQFHSAANILDDIQSLIPAA